MTDTPFQTARRQFEALDTLAGPYFSGIDNRPATLAWFRETQIQFGFAVREWPRALSYLAARIPHSAERWPVVLNLLDEHGEGDASRFHSVTFKLFLSRLGVEPARIRRAVPGPAVDAFNTALVGTCFHEPVAVAASATGMIELMFSAISEQIADSVVDNNWVGAAQIVHYDLHAALDIEHAKALFGIVAEDWRTERGRAQVLRGIALGGHLFDRLYRDLAALRSFERSVCCA